MLSKSILDLGKCPIRKRMKVHVFWLGHFAMSKIKFESSFPLKYYIITVVIFFGAFQPIFNKVKKWISHCIFNSCNDDFQNYRSHNIQFHKANTDPCTVKVSEALHVTEHSTEPTKRTKRLQSAHKNILQLEKQIKVGERFI